MEAYLVSANDLASQWTESMWPAVWQSTVLAIALSLLTRLRKNAPALFRFWVWMLVPLRLLVMPVVSVSIPILPAPPDYEAAQPASVDFSSAAPLNTRSQWDTPAQGALVPALAEAPSIAPPEVRPQAHVSWQTLVLTAWGIGAFAVTLRMARGWRWVRRIVADSEPAREGPIAMAARKAASMLSLKTVPHVVVTEANVSPFTCGVRRPLVVLPRSFVQNANNYSLLAVLAHEFAHVRRRDSLIGFVLCVCDALYFFHPVAHIARRRILFEREKACDALVLAASKARPSAYANAICDAALLSRNACPLTSPPLLVAESFGDLTGRLNALASGVAPKASLSRSSVMVLGLLGVLCVPGIMLTAIVPVESISVPAATAPFDQTPPEVSAPSPARDASVEREASGAQEQPAATRTIRFPSDRALGVLYTETTPESLRYRLGPNYNAVDSWDVYAAAKGTVTVPVDAKVKLVITGAAVKGDLSPLKRLKSDDLYAIRISLLDDIRTYADSTIMPNLRTLTGLKELDICLPDVTNQGMASLRKLTGLQYLRIRSLGVTNAGLENLEDMKSLRVLNLWTTTSDEGLAHIGKLSALKELSLRVANVRGPGLEHLAALPELEYLQLGGELDNSCLQYLRGFPALKCLRLQGGDARITNAGMKHIGEIPGLEELYLVGFEGITDAGLTYLKPLRSLRLLEVNKCITTDAGVAAISEIGSLEELMLSNNPKSVLTDVGLSYLPKLKNLRSLSTMGWSKTPITDEGLRYLSKMSSLRELQVCGGEGITDTGIAFLARMSNLEKLLLLSDSHGITDASLAEIGKMTRLRTLDLNCTFNPFTVSGLNKLNSLGELRFLSIGANRQGDEVLDWSGLTHLENLMLGLPHISEPELERLGKITSLKRLQSMTGISDAGLAHLSGLTDLQLLSIQRSNLSDNALQHVQNMKKLYSLTISGKFSSEGLKQLETLSGLQYLSIRNINPMDEATQARLQRNLPNLLSLRLDEPEGYGGFSAAQ